MMCDGVYSGKSDLLTTLHAKCGSHYDVIVTDEERCWRLQEVGGRRET